MEQSITLKIAGKEFPLKVTSPEMEQVMRIAAEKINEKLTAYDAKFPGKELVDKLIFVALTETVSRLTTQRKLSLELEQEKALLSQIECYMEKIEK